MTGTPLPGSTEPDTIVDDVLAGRRFPYSRAFARAGFTALEAELWRRAGWHDPERAAPWHDIGTAATPQALLALAEDGYDATVVTQVAAFVPTLTVAWTRALTAPSTPPKELDLRDRVLANLHRDSGPRDTGLRDAKLRHPASWSEDQLV